MWSQIEEGALDVSAKGREPVSRGMIHGRFQPFHVGHLEYLRLAQERCDELAIGITNPDGTLTEREATDQRRHRAEDNPFTYWERLLMIEAVFSAEGIVPPRIVPFPIGVPERLGAYVPDGAVHLLRVFDDWGTTKVERLRGLGYAVEVLDPEAEKGVSGTEVRACMRSGGDWKSLVPPPVVRVIEALSLERAPNRRLAV